MQDDDERVVAPSVQIAAEVEDLELVGDVQEGGGLVEEKQRGLLSQDEGEPGALALTAGELVHPAMGETRDPGGAHGRLDGGVVLLRPLPEHALIGESPPADEVAHGDALRTHRALRKQAESSCDRLRGVGRDVAAIQKHSAAPWGQKSGQRAQQSGFAAGVRADDDGERAVWDRDIQMLADDALTVGERDVIGLHGRLRRLDGGHVRPLLLRCAPGRPGPLSRVFHTFSLADRTHSR